MKKECAVVMFSRMEDVQLLAVIQLKSLPPSLLTLSTDSLFSRIAHEETNYSVVYFKAGSTETYEIQIEQGY